MSTIKEIFETEKKRREDGRLNVIHLFRDGNTYKAYEWSAWLCREYAVSDEWLQQVGAKRLNPVHKSVKQTSGNVIFVGFPPTSIDKFIPKSVQMEYVAVSDTLTDIAIELPADICGEEPVSYDAMLAKFQEWKQSFPVKEEKPKRDTGAGGNGGGTGGTALQELQALLPYKPGQPMRMSDILAQLVALPVEDISPNDALAVLRILKRQATALF